MAYYIAEITPLFGSFELNRGWEPPTLYSSLTRPSDCGRSRRTSPHKGCRLLKFEKIEYMYVVLKIPAKIHIYFHAPCMKMFRS